MWCISFGNVVYIMQLPGFFRGKTDGMFAPYNRQKTKKGMTIAIKQTGQTQPKNT